MKRMYIQPLPVRIWHWLNLACVLVLIVSGLQIRYPGALDLMPFPTALSVHHWSGFALIANYVLWFIYYFFFDPYKVYRPEFNVPKLARQMSVEQRYYGYGMFVGEPHPHHVSPANKYNTMQRTMYQVVMLLLIPIVIVTGVLMYDLDRFGAIVDALGGVRVIDTVHVLIFAFFAFFLFFHPYLTVLGHVPEPHITTDHIKAMVTGWEDEH